MKHFLIFSLFALAILSAGPAAAAGDMAGHAMDGQLTDKEPADQAMGEVNREYMKAMGDMHGDMLAGIMEPDPDTAFARGMLAHHEGAVEMARIELKHGKDPELRKLAQAIITAQEKEIRFMRHWLAGHGDDR